MTQYLLSATIPSEFMPSQCLQPKTVFKSSQNMQCSISGLHVLKEQSSSPLLSTMCFDSKGLAYLKPLCTVKSTAHCFLGPIVTLELNPCVTINLSHPPSPRFFLGHVAMLPQSLGFLVRVQPSPFSMCTSCKGEDPLLSTICFDSKELAYLQRYFAQ